MHLRRVSLENIRRFGSGAAARVEAAGTEIEDLAATLRVRNAR